MYIHSLSRRLSLDINSKSLHCLTLVYDLQVHPGLELETQSKWSRKCFMFLMSWLKACQCLSYMDFSFWISGRRCVSSDNKLTHSMPCFFSRFFQFYATILWICWEIASVLEFYVLLKKLKAVQKVDWPIFQIFNLFTDKLLKGNVKGVQLFSYTRTPQD